MTTRSGMAEKDPRVPAEVGSEPDGGLRLEIHRDWESAAAIEPEWDRFGEEVGGDVYLSPAWCRVWWRHYGRGEPRILAVRRGEGSPDSGRLVAVLPMFIERRWTGPVPLRLAKFIGSDSTIVVLSPPVVPSLAESCYRLAIRHLLGPDRCHAASFGPLSGEEDRTEPIVRACAASGDPPRTAKVRRVGVHTVFPLPESFEAYLSSLDKNHRSNLRRNLNGLTKNFGFASRAITDPRELDSHFPAFVRMHTAQWAADRRLGHFGDWPGSTEFSEDLVRELAPRGRVSLVCLSAAGRPVSYYWNFTYGRGAAWRLPARESGEEWDRRGLGRVGLVKMIEAMIAAGLRTVEGGPGHYDYKLQHGATEHPLRTVLVVRGTGYARFSARLAELAADLLHLGYYRAWRGRLLPRLEVTFLPLWRAWIRSRI